jgi:hypothetical protein
MLMASKWRSHDISDRHSQGCAAPRRRDAQLMSIGEKMQAEQVQGPGAAFRRPGAEGGLAGALPYDQGVAAERARTGSP